MYHSINFETLPLRGGIHKKFNTYDDLGLVPVTRPVIPPPAVKTHSIEIPGTSGSVDLTESLTPYLLYQNRSGSIEFAVITEHYHWATLYSKIMNWIHGHRAKIILEDDPAWYYEGRFAVNGWNTGSGTCPTVAIDYDLYPYKMSIVTAREMDVEPWKWDPFSFYDGIITDPFSPSSDIIPAPPQIWKTYSAAYGIFTEINVPNSSWNHIGIILPEQDQIDDQIQGSHFNRSITGWMPVVPSVTFSSPGMGIKIENDQLGYEYSKTYDSAGTYSDPELILYDWFGGYKIYLKGPGTASIDFRKGSL